MDMQHKHDCDKCKPLGQFEQYDFYYCDQGDSYKIPTVIARYGEDGDYMSGLIFGKSGLSPIWAIAYHMARAKGYLGELE